MTNCKLSTKMVDTHCHLGGCISPQFIWSVIKNSKLSHIAESEQAVIDCMTFSAKDKPSFHRFLDKFKVLETINWNEELIDSSVKDICNNINSSGVDYVILDFSINKYMNIGWHKHEAVKFIYDSFQRYSPNKVGLVLSLKYESFRDNQKQYSKLIEHEIASKCLIGLDLVGDEQYFDHEFYEPIFEEWNKANKLTRTHAGESQSAANVANSIKHLKVTNIAHGIKISENGELLKLAADSGVFFDMTISSNYYTGVLVDKSVHPLTNMLRNGVKVTIGSDDPVQCSTTLHREYELLKNYLTEQEIDKVKSNAIELVCRVFNNIKLF